MRHLQILIPLLLCVSIVLGQDIPKPMTPKRLVNDFTGLLTEDQRNNLENKLVAFNDSTSTQISVVTYDDLQGYSIAEFASSLGTEWGIGQSARNNGILILISPANHQMTIQTGYGLEGAVPDAICKRIIVKEITPAFRENNFYKGIDDATNTLMALTKGEYTADEYMKKTGSGEGTFPIVVLFIVFFVIFSSIRSRKRIYSREKQYPGGC